MFVTATEFKENFGKNLSLVSKEDIFITKNGKTVDKVINPNIFAVDQIKGLLKGADRELITNSIREERLLKYENFG